MKEILNNLQQAMHAITQDYYGEAKGLLYDAERQIKEKDLYSYIIEDAFKEARNAIVHDDDLKSVYGIAMISYHLSRECCDNTLI